MSIPHLIKTVSKSPQKLYGESIEVVKYFRPEWQDSDLWVTPMTDGLTNQIVGCFLPNKSHDIVLVRVYGDNTQKFIDRGTEARNMNFLHSQKFGPAVYGTFSNGICYGFEPGYALEPHMLKDELLAKKIAERLAQLHAVQCKEACSQEPVLFSMALKYAGLCPKLEESKSLKSFGIQSKTDLVDELLQMQRFVDELPLPVVFSHNDLLAENVLYNEETQTVSFIDYEYAGFNYQAYDIANHFNEFAGKITKDLDFSRCPDDAFQKEWLGHYLRAYKIHAGEKHFGDQMDAEIQELHKQVKIFTVYSHLFWAIWALALSQYASHDFDYFEYGQKRLQQYFKTKEALLSKLVN